MGSGLLFDVSDAYDFHNRFLSYNYERENEMVSAQRLSVWIDFIYLFDFIYDNPLPSGNSVDLFADYREGYMEKCDRDGDSVISVCTSADADADDQLWLYG